jgi:hypothetical protein
MSVSSDTTPKTFNGWIKKIKLAFHAVLRIKVCIEEMEAEFSGVIPAIRRLRQEDSNFETAWAALLD